MSEKLQPDYSTINMHRLKMRPIYKLPPTYHISTSMGAGCYGDAPGYPSYFLQSVYTQYGNTPPNAPDYVIRDDAGNYRRIDIKYAYKDGKHSDNRKAILDRLFVPLPLSHLRVRLWIKHTYQHMARCYGDPLNGDKQRHVSDLVTWPPSRFHMPLRPVQHMKDYAGRTFHMTDSEYADVLAGYRAEVSALWRDAYRVCVDVNNHLAVLAIREFYPKHQAIFRYIWNPPQLSQADWWERYAHLPAGDECPGWNDKPHNQYDYRNNKARYTCLTCGQ